MNKLLLLSFLLLINCGEKKPTANSPKLPVDGVDETIILKTGEDEISKMNAFDNKTWNKILELQSKHINQE